MFSKSLRVILVVFLSISLVLSASISNFKDPELIKIQTKYLGVFNDIEVLDLLSEIQTSAESIYDGIKEEASKFFY
jgi:hypothetical protein